MADLHSDLIEKEFSSVDAVALSPLVRRITAPNSGPMTGPGTNTYLLGRDDITVIDPGPNIESHVNAIYRAGGDNIKRIVVTHTHPDHSPAAVPLAKLCGADLIGCTISDDGHQDRSFKPDVDLYPQMLIEARDHSLDAIATPGHVGNHYCFYLREERMVFTGDHIMQGSTVVIIPPSGDMADYISSLQALLAFQVDCLAPAHGHLMARAEKVVREIIDHRLARETKVIAGLQQHPNASLNQLVDVVYHDVDPRLKRIAGLSLWAHLLKLEKEGRARKRSEEHWLYGDELWSLTRTKD